MILQLSGIFSGLASALAPIGRELLTTGLDIGKQFLARELNRKNVRAQKDLLKSQLVQSLNTPGISVARIGGTTQPVGGRVQRGVFTPAAQTPAQSAIGNVPLAPIPISPTFTANRPRSFQAGRTRTGTPLFFPDFTAGLPRNIGLNGGDPRTPGVSPGAPIGPPGINGGVRMPGQKFALDEMGRVQKFVPSPRPGEGFLPVSQARALFGKAMKPFWRFNRLTGMFEKIKARRMNPFNFKATARAGRRIERTLDAIKDVVTIQRKMEKGVSAGGKVVRFKTRGKKRRKRA